MRKFMLLLARRRARSRSARVAVGRSAREGQEQAAAARHPQRRVHSRLGRRPPKRCSRTIGPKNGFDVTCWRFTERPGQEGEGARAARRWSTALEAYTERFRGSDQAAGREGELRADQQGDAQELRRGAVLHDRQPGEQGRTRRPARVGEGRRGTRRHALRHRHAVRRVGLRRPDRRLLQDATRRGCRRSR